MALFKFVLFALLISWETPDSREVPSWWTDAKFGVFVHWGPYSVPAYAPTDSDIFGLGYAEWYAGRLYQDYPEFLNHHKEHYGNAPYENFAAEFKAEKFDAREWAKLFKSAGAKYVVLTAKHHDGYALWPSPESAYYNSTVLGSGRDLVGEFAEAMHAEGLRRGFYYSLLEFVNPRYPGNLPARKARALEKLALAPKDWARQMNLPQLKELVEAYAPDIIWADGEWEHSDEEQLAVEFLTWLYTESKVKDEVVANDRWGSNTKGKHGGHYTTEYSMAGGDKSGLSSVHPWEECRGLGKSFGYNREETEKDYMTRVQCLETLVSVVSRGGNLLLNVGPRADGTIPEIMRTRLLEIGEWLSENGEAIYATHPATLLPRPRLGSRVYLTEKDDTVNIISFDSAALKEYLAELPKDSAAKIKVIEVNE